MNNCTGMPMSMYMDGFHWSSSHCLIFLFRDWILDSAQKFQGALVWSFLLALCLEALNAIRPKCRGWAMPLMYAIQALVGYLLMFLAMNFSLPILGSVVMGLAVGNLLWFRYPSLQQQSPNERYLNPSITTPLLG